METLLERVKEYLPAESARFVEQALEFAAEAHKGQTRRSGGPYIDHPVEAASYLANLKLDAPTVAAVSPGSTWTKSRPRRRSTISNSRQVPP